MGQTFSVKDIEMFHAGWDILTKDFHNPELIPKCKVCDQEMIHEEVEGFRSFSASFLGNKTNFVRYTCPNSNERWHEQVLSLKQNQEECCSMKICTILQEEIDEILVSKTPTKS